MREIKDAIQAIVSEMMPKPPVSGTVIAGSYIPESGTVDVMPDNGDAEILDVRIQASYDNSAGIVAVPADGSAVIVTYLNENEAFISMFSRIDSLILYSDSNGGLVKILPLVEKLNNLEKLVNDLALKFNAHTHPVAGVTLGGGTVTSAITAMIETEVLIPTQKIELENEKVKHGSA